MSPAFDAFGAVAYFGPVVDEVNRRIAPAVIEADVVRDPSLNAYRFRGRWGTLRFEFAVDLDYAGRGRDLVSLLEQHTARAVDGAIRSLTEQEVEKSAAPLRREIRALAADLAALRQRLDEAEARRPMRRLRTWLRSLRGAA